MTSLLRRAHAPPVSSQAQAFSGPLPRAAYFIRLLPVLHLQVEIVMRVLRRWTPEDDEVLDPEAVRLAELVTRVGQDAATCLLPGCTWHGMLSGSHWLPGFYVHQ